MYFPGGLPDDKSWVQRCEAVFTTSLCRCACVHDYRLELLANVCASSSMICSVLVDFLRPMAGLRDEEKTDESRSEPAKIWPVD